ncbi:MAG: branched-chain amino acid ABC transporter permease [Nitrospinaceae bacterium]|nr:branched-chain amino acid ABC transporter permease [Nitrospinaceae bacterium]MBT3432868.1 branched-chain amino acid ABC transporter permease [Nitrospinaceae bacterium]MBT3821264.1 branched-chain amino acid ABC transporter permease [Nitrospinaceae bacterium]MBT4094077.1 branched-chain amino acid ABC transporter permease [Nitrospinaceae bacterium]MBT4432354.1 branched-chain amino acid ABC transporter permease [Nitrospinaceae bacterium]
MEAASGVELAEFLQHLFLGLVQGSFYVLLALGLSIIFGLMGIINFGHGVFYMLGSYVGYTIISLVVAPILGENVAFIFALAAVPAIMFGIGMFFEKIIISQIYNTENERFRGVLITFGLSIFLPDFVRIIWGRPGKSFNIPPMFQWSILEIGSLNVSAYRTFVVFVAAILVAMIWFLLFRTNLGMVIRAGTSNNIMVQVLGINVSKVWRQTFGLGIALAGFAGVMISPLFAVDPTMGDDILIQTFIVVVVGGMGSFIGPVIGGLIIGQLWALTPLIGRTTFVINNLSGTMIGPEFWEKASDILFFVLMSVILILRPRGLFGQEGAFD